jgi:hypothetical protein
VDRQPHAVPRASVAANFDKPLYIRLNLPPEITFHFVLFVKNISNLANLFFAKLFDPEAWSNTTGSHNALA